MKENIGAMNPFKRMVLERRENCTGVLAHKVKGRGYCVLCKRETRSFCLRCRMPCCGHNTTRDVFEADEIRFNVPVATGGADDRDSMLVKNTCFLELRMDALRKIQVNGI